MHHNDVVVLITDSKDKNYREYGFSQNDSQNKKIKKSTVVLPFDSEYKISINNKNIYYRILVEIDIDGTNVSGNGIIIDPSDKINIERFIDIPNKFKFVASDSDGVADATSDNNGKISITIHKENNIYRLFPKNVETKNFYHLNIDNERFFKRDDSCGNYKFGDTEFDFRPYCNVDGGIGNNHVANYSSSANISTTPENSHFFNDAINEKGATIEGDSSNQIFSQTSWGGSNEYRSVIFEFNMKGRSETIGMGAEESAEYDEYKRLKEKFGKIDKQL